MTQKQVLTAETERGQLAIAEVMQHSYTVDIGYVPPSWARALVVDGEPVSFIVVDPERRMAQPGGDVHYAFICDAVTREDRRGEGHFRTIIEHTFASLRVEGIPLVVTHGRYQLYRRFGFDVFTHHSGIFTTPEQIERKLGTQAPENAAELLTVDESKYLHEDLLLVTEVKAATFAESKVALQAAAAQAYERGKARILFEYPPAPSYGSRYPIYSSLETPFTVLALTSGAQICVQGAAPEDGVIPDADWIRVLDAAAFLREALQEREKPRRSLPEEVICFDTGAGAATIESVQGSVAVSDGVKPNAIRVAWPSSALAQLVTGYKPAEALCAIHNTELLAETVALLRKLFPKRWRFSRNESWTYKS